MPRHQLVDRAPRGILQDAGELAVITPNQGETHHRFAMVVAFDNEQDLRRALNSHACRYRDGHAIEELRHE